MGGFPGFLLATFAGLFFSTVTYAQTIRGRITDSAGRPLEAASLYVAELSSGTVANRDGYYELKVAPGVYTCIFRNLGYATQTHTVTVENSTVERNVHLEEQPYSIEAVMVRPGREDRAYGIMRRAIAMAPYYLHQVSEYSADVYLKGSFDVVKISRLVKGVAGEAIKDFKQGENYMQESFNEVEFTAPNKYNQRVIKQSSSMPEGIDGAEESAMTLVNINIYEPNALPMVISPLSPGAFSHYRFVYEGYVMERGRVINKIRIVPMRKSQQLVSGHIYIADNHWNVHNLDVSGHLSVVAGIDFSLQVNYGEVNENVWMPTSHRIDFDLSFMGSRMKARYVASVKYNRLVENTSIRRPDGAVPDKPATPTVPQTKFSNRDSYRAARQAAKEMEATRRTSLDITEEVSDNLKITVDTLAREPDPEFWDRVRPVALEPIELEGYRDRGIVATAQRDTTATGRRGRSFVGKALTGSTKPLKLGEKGGELVWRGIVPSQIGFNTVDGFYVGIAPVTYRKTFSNAGKTSIIIAPEVVWAINRHVAMGDVVARLRYAPMRRGAFDIRVGSVSRDFGGAGGILPIENTVASLFFRRNYLKLYQDNFVEANNTIDLAGGLALSASFKYSHREGLDNTSDYSFFYRKQRVYTPNFEMPDHTAATFLVGLEYTPRQYYRVSDGRKVPVRSAWPTFFAAWKKGVNGLGGSDVDFDHISGGVMQNIALGNPMHTIGYYVRGGVFVNTGGIFLPDVMQFDTEEMPLVNSSLTYPRSFKLLQYYRPGTADRYLEAHVVYQARFLVLKLLPWFSNRLWQEGLQLNYLTTPGLKNYMEAGYTIGMLWQAGVFVGFENFKYRSVGFKLSIPIRITRTPR